MRRNLEASLAGKDQDADRPYFFFDHPVLQTSVLLRKLPN
jgi:hypothetical protein